MRYSLILLVLAALSACQKPLSSWDKPVPQPLPYQFSISHVVDSRPNNKPYENLNVYPFNRSAVSSMIMGHLPSSLFAPHQALLQLEVIEYTTTAFNKNYALSYGFNLTAQDGYNRTIHPTTTYTCAKSKQVDFAAHRLAASLYKGESISNKAQSDNIFAELMDTCLKETLDAFYAKLIQTQREM